MPKKLSQRFTVIVLADTEFGTIEFLSAVRSPELACCRGHARSTALHETGETLASLYRRGKRGQQVYLLWNHFSSYRLLVLAQTC